MRIFLAGRCDWAAADSPVGSGRARSRRLTRAKAEAQARVTFLNQSFEVLFAQQKPDSHNALQGIGKELEMSISKVNFNTSTKPFLALPGRSIVRRSMGELSPEQELLTSKGFGRLLTWNGPGT